MGIPVYVVTGFLDAGKTTFLNNLLAGEDRQGVRTLVFQFESGEEPLQSRQKDCVSQSFSKKLLERHPEQIVAQIYGCIQSRWQSLDEIWIEWNGVVPFSQLQALLSQEPLRGLCRIQTVIHIADGANFEKLLGGTGGVLPEQIANSDFAAVRDSPSPAADRRLRRLLNGMNPGIGIFKIQDKHALYRRLYERRGHPAVLFMLAVFLIVAVFYAARPILELMQAQAAVDTVVNICLGILLQAIPFLLIGVLLSSAIQVLIPPGLIERKFPKSLGAGMLAAILGGFCLPVCDCASIPIFKSLVRRGVPLPVAVTFMTVTPVINPVVIASTYYAFCGSLTIVAGRVCIGIVAAVLIGLSFALWPPKGEVLTGGALDGLMCSCGCYEQGEIGIGFSGKAALFLRHSQAEFFSVGKYLLIGTFVAAAFQAVGTDIFTAAQSGAGLALSILIMMLMAFVLSLCSSSDAVIARSFVNQFPLGALMGFLVFGPMMDIKNVMMLSSAFSKRFIARLVLTAFVVCFTAAFLLAGLGGM